MERYNGSNRRRNATGATNFGHTSSIVGNQSATSTSTSLRRQSATNIISQQSATQTRQQSDTTNMSLRRQSATQIHQQSTTQIHQQSVTQIHQQSVTHTRQQSATNKSSVGTSLRKTSSSTISPNSASLFKTSLGKTLTTTATTTICNQSASHIHQSTTSLMAKFASNSSDSRQHASLINNHQPSIRASIPNPRHSISHDPPNTSTSHRQPQSISALISQGNDNRRGDERKGNNGGEVNNIVLKVQLHCQGCTDRIRKSILAFPGVLTVNFEGEDEAKVVAHGYVDAQKLRDKVEEKIGKKVELVSPNSRRRSLTS